MEGLLWMVYTNKEIKLIRLVTVLLWSVLFLIPTNVLHAEFTSSIPGNNHYIDDINLLDKDTKAFINDKNKVLSNKLGSEIIVVVVGELEDTTPFDYSVDLFDKYQPGTKDKDNGILMLLSIDKESEKEYQFEVRTGYGVEGILNDGKVGRILDESTIPSFNEGQYSVGIQNSVSAFADELIANKEEITSDLHTSEDEIISKLFIFGLILIGIVLDISLFGGHLTYVIINVLVSSSGNNGGRNSGGGSTGGGGASR